MLPGRVPLTFPPAMRNVRSAMKPSSAEHGEILVWLLSVSCSSILSDHGVNVDHINYIVDFEQPRALWSKVWGDKEREAYVQNVSGHFKNVKNPEVKARQRKQ